MTRRIAVRACTRVMQYVRRNYDVICYRFSVKWNKMMALQNGLHQRGSLGQILRGRLGHVVGWFFLYAIIIMH